MSKPSSPSSPPRDPFNLVFLDFYLLGVGTLLPWNFFISVADYWKFKWRTVDVDEEEMILLGDEGGVANSSSSSLSDVVEGLEKVASGMALNDMQLNWSSHLAVASMVPNVTFLLLNAAFGHRFRTQPRLLVSLIMVVVLFTFTAAMSRLDTIRWQDAFYVVTLVSVVLINVNASIFQGGLLGVAGKFPPRYINAVFSGQALGGIFASATNVILLFLGAAVDVAAFLCFVIAVVFLTACLACFLAVTRSEFYQHYVGEGGKDRKKDKEAAEEEEETQIAKPPPGEAEKLMSVSNGVASASASASASGDPTLPTVSVSGPTTTRRRVNPVAVLGKILPYAFSIFLVFCVTLGCFPAVTALVSSVDAGPGGSDWANVYFVPVACFLLFNVGDYLGRFAAGKAQWPRPGRAGGAITLALSAARSAFIPLFLMCNANPHEPRSLTPLLIPNDYAYMAIMLAFSVSNGYIGSVCLMSAPQVCLPEEQQTAASLTVAMLGLGLGAGALSSNLFVKML